MMMWFTGKLLILMILVAFVASQEPIHNQTAKNAVEEEEEDYDYEEGEGENDVIDLSYLGDSAFGAPNTSLGRVVENWDESSNVNPEELGTYFEGDILMETVTDRSAVTDMSRRWPGGIVPYRIASNFPQKQLQIIQDAINQYNTKTCLRFVRQSGEKDYINIKGDNTGCWSSVGKTGGPQTVNVQMQGCLGSPGTIIHELMHAIGFLHEQSRPDRDQYIRINYQNVQSGMQSNFEKGDSRQYTTLGVKYDYGSVMHYSPTAFSKNGQPTLAATQTGGNKMGQRQGFSAADLARINSMYCKGGTKPGGTGLPGRPIGSGANKPGKPTGNKKPRPGFGGGIKPIKPFRPFKPILGNKPGRPFANLLGNRPFGLFGFNDQNETENNTQTNQ